MATKQYSNGEVTVVWKSDLCIHSKKCFNGLPEVFDPNKRPWVNIGGADTKTIVEHVKRCPSGALSYNMTGDEKKREADEEQTVEVIQDGPLMVYGNIKVKMSNGSEESRNRTTAFCRCGSSDNKPFCDGSHKKVGFRG